MHRIAIIFSICLAICSLIEAAQPLPDFRLRDTENHWQTFDDIRGASLTIIDFWATWCAPCVRAFPHLIILHQKYKAQGVGFVGISIDSPRNIPKVQPFTRAHKLTYPVLLDPNSEYASRLQVVNVPTLLIISSKREIIYRHEGYQPGDEKIIEREIENALEAEKIDLDIREQDIKSIQ
jgi:thiol-disulfide isomerase/thioredoxin